MAALPRSSPQPDPDLAGGLLLGRARFHVSYRLLVRLYGLLADRDLSAAHRGAVALSLASDVGWFARMHTSDSAHLWPRLVCDSLDVAYWSAVSPTDSDHATLISVPLAIEAGARRGARALAVPIAIAGTAAVARRLRGRRTPPMFLLWPTAGVLAGMATARNARRQDAVTLGEQAVRAEARAGSAYVAGQNAVAMGADSVIDLLTRTEPILAALEEQLSHDRSGEDASLSGTAVALAEWKAELAETSAGRAAYLGTLLARWERTRSAHDLTRDLVLRLPPGAGTTLVSAHQGDWILEQLDHLGLHGEQSVAVPDSTEPGMAFVLGVGHHLLEVPADPDPLVRAYEHAPVILAVGALWSVVAALPDNEDVGWAVLPGVVGSLALAAWTHRRVRERKPAVDNNVMAALVGVCALHGAVVTLAQRRQHDARGLPLFPQFGGPMNALVLLTSLRTPRRLDPALLRSAALVMAGLLPGFAVARIRGPARPAAAALASLNLLAWWACMWGAGDDLAEHRDRLIATSRAESVRLEGEARRAGTARVHDLVEEAWENSGRRLEAVMSEASTSDLDAATTEKLREVTDRLAAAEAMLEAIGEAPAVPCG